MSQASADSERSMLPSGRNFDREVGFAVPADRLAEHGPSKKPLGSTASDRQVIPKRLVGVPMPALKASSEGGGLLRAERMRVRLSTRDVERLSRTIAEEKKSQDYYISHAWLTDAENGAYAPGIFKLYSLSVIYKRRYDEILGFFGIELSDLVHEQGRLTLPRTHLIGTLPELTLPSLQIASKITEGVDLGKTNLVSRMFGQWGGMPVSLFSTKGREASVYGYVGTEDFTLYPLIRPGSFVEIDSNQNRVERSGWQNEFDRPIYFVELRDSYACSWCEPREGKLLLIPCPQSRKHVREVRFPGDSEIVGRVTAVSMRIAG